MIGKKIGTYTDFFTDESPVNGYVIKAIFEKEKMKGGGSTKLSREDVENTVKVEFKEKVNAIMIQYSQDKLVVRFSEHLEKKTDEVGILKNIATFAIDVDTLDVYSSEY